jgi:hypothetical protein
MFQRKGESGVYKTLYKFPFIGLFLMVFIIFIFGTFLGSSKVGDSGYDIYNEVTTAQPSTTTSKITYLLLPLI